MNLIGSQWQWRSMLEMSEEREVESNITCNRREITFLAVD